MNERLKRLAEQAGIHDDVCSMCPIHELDKFAELIVRECIDTAFHRGHPDLEFLLKHFGVEE